MGHSNNNNRIWFSAQVATLLICTAIGWCACTSALPKQLHCSSSVVMRDISSSKSLTTYHVDEYLDFKGERSSLSVEDVKRSDTRIYYNQLHLQGYAERKFLMYSPMSQTCKPQSVIDWQLNELRKVSIHMYTLDTLQRDYVDIPMGPSVILYAVLENARDFKFITTIWSRARLANVDVYGRQMDHMPVDGWNKMNMIVHVPSKTNRDYRLSVGDPLTKYLDKAQRRAQLVMIGGCLVEDDGSSTLDARHAFSLPFSNINKLAEETFCEHDNLRFIIRYNIVTEYRPGTLIGKSLSDFGAEYSFNREPFLQPPGIGCWGSLIELPGVAPKWQRTISKSMAGSQLSGEYITTRGSRGVSYVAYDQVRRLLRLDRYGRKSVYDLLERRSYHVGEFSPGFETTQTSKRNELLGQCVVLNMDQEIKAANLGTSLTSSMLRDPTGEFSLLARLIGLTDGNDGREHYLGTRTVDHVAYEVFEREWSLRESAGELPILMRANKFEPTLDADKRLYLTYYIRLDYQQRQVQEEEEVEPSSGSPMMIIKFIELYEFDVLLKRKTIINRLRFIEFSWSLDAMPTNDYDGGHSSHSATLGVFDLEPCQRARSRQLELVVEFKQEREKRLAPSQVDLMRTFELEISERLVSLFASTIEVSRLNIVDMRVQILPTGDMISTNKFVDLYQGLTELTQLGKLERRPSEPALPGWRTSILRVMYNRYSLEECLPDAFAWPEPNWLAYCPAVHECLLVRRGTQDELNKWLLNDGVDAPAQQVPTSDQARKNSKIVSSNQSIVCTLYSHRYSTSVNEADYFRYRSAADAAELNSWLLNRNALELKFKIDSGSFEYVARAEVRHVRQLDPIGASLANSRATLAGMRHTTRDETGPESINLNQRVSLAYLRAGETAFRHCQLACQMDDLCASFSVCDERGRDAPNYCVLSSLRLSAERTVRLIGRSAHTDSKGQFQIKITSACESQVFVMQRDDACALHTRDFLADYRVLKVKISRQMQDVKEAVASQIDGQQQQQQEQQVSLDECAGLSSELNLFEDPKQVEFTYCPLESRCFISDNKLTGTLTTSHQTRGHGQCYVYAKRLSQAYQIKRMHHLSIKMRAAVSSKSEGEGSAEMSPREPVVPASLVSPSSLPGDDQENELAKQIVTRMWDLSEEKCARECNLHHSTCLSFDTCQQAGKTLCLLYSIRSPLAQQSAYLPPLKLEQQVRDNADLSITSKLVCDHYYLKPGYFEVRLGQLRNREQQQQQQQRLSGPGSKLDEMENLIEESDRERSKEELEKLHGEYEQLERERQRRMRNLIEMAHVSWLHTAFLAAGLLAGCLCALYKNHLISHSSAQMRNLPWFRRQAGGVRDDLNELVQNDQMI